MTLQLCRDSYKAAKKLRAQNVQEELLVLLNCKILDVVAGQYRNVYAIKISGGKIQQIEEPKTDVPTTKGVPRIVIDCGGKVVLPGGADFGLAQAVDEGAILGPRLLFTGHALSQTGGHGDMRGRGEDCCACGAALRGIGRTCDGDAEVRRAARDELRKGAHCIKIMASGGVASPTDRLTNTQFSMEEMRAIVEEAQAAGTYVCAHAYTAPAISRALRAGVRSIEHGNYIDAATAEQMAEAGAFLVPTLITYAALQESGESAGMPKELVAKVGDCVEKGVQALELARAAGVTMCFGSDLLGDLHRHQGREFKMRAPVVPALELLQAATINCARLFAMEHQIGQVKEGMVADLILVDGDPLENIECLSEERRILLVLKEGLLAKVPDAQLAAVNDRLFSTT